MPSGKQLGGGIHPKKVFDSSIKRRSNVLISCVPSSMDFTVEAVNVRSSLEVDVFDPVGDVISASERD